MSDDPDYILDIQGLDDPAMEEADGAAAGRGLGSRKWIGVQFECCGSYARVYKNRDGTAYEGRCPRCLRSIEVGIGPGGTDQRMFRAT